jgi:uracil phosphoribosyltransferase
MQASSMTAASMQAAGNGVKGDSHMRNVILHAADLDGFLEPGDRRNIDSMSLMYGRAVELFRSYAEADAGARKKSAEKKLIAFYNEMGDRMREITGAYRAVHVYSFETHDTIHGEASRLIAKLRNAATEQPEFIYYVQRAYELLFNFAFVGTGLRKKNYMIVRTPVDVPVQNYAVHKIPDIQPMVSDAVMCVLLRGALLPSMILSKEIEEFSSDRYVTPFALFKISRDDRREEHTMVYTLMLDRSYFDLDALHGKDLFFADPMNATGGSLITIVRYLTERGIRPRSIKTFNVVSALKGALRIMRAFDNAEVYTLWMDPALNRKAYIVPGLGDAGDRLNGPDREKSPRDIIQLIAGYGAGIAALYRSQVRKIEQTVLGSS